MNSFDQFADLAQLDADSVRRLLGEVLISDCYIALRDSENPGTQVMFRNMSDDVRNFVQEDVEAREGVEMHEIHAAQNRILDVARGLFG